MLLIEVVRVGRPSRKRRESRATRTHCRANHELVAPNTLVSCGVCHGKRALETYYRSQARKAGKPIPVFAKLVCNHDLSISSNQLIECKECSRVTNTTRVRRKTLRVQSQS